MIWNPEKGDFEYVVQTAEPGRCHYKALSVPIQPSRGLKYPAGIHWNILEAQATRLGVPKNTPAPTMQTIIDLSVKNNMS